ncbi:MAG: hypothetical protein SVX43_10735 [Cyanobacteriota bacterium]|nr:hypothetical protein [Cyanobacteriota bacterium]
MKFFHPTEPIFRRKQEALDVQDLEGLFHLRFKIQGKTLISVLYTRIDQVFVLWGLISATIFFTAQFAPISWVTQAIFWSILSAVGCIGMIVLTHFWVKIEQLRWLLYSWVALMLVGAIVTDLGIFLSWGWVLTNLCNLWLVLSAVGYICTGVGMQSRAFLLAAIAHLAAIAILPYVGGYQFLATGIAMTATLLIFAETQWDMRPPLKNNDRLTLEQRQFNEEQCKLRQLSI